MKKNFLMVASLLIAAMLMVVSCTQEVAPKNGLVEVKLGVGYGRDLTVSGDTSTKDMVLKYTMAYAWDNPADTKEEILGAKSTKTVFIDGQAIGYVTPGLWTVHVYAYENGKSGNDDKPIFEGNAQAYFSNKNDSVTVYLAPTSEQANSIRFAVAMQDLVGDVDGAYKGKGSYVLKYSLQRASETETGETVINKVSEENNPLPEGISFGDLNNSSVYYAIADNLTSGYYRATVKVYSIKEDGSPEKLVGGISKGFLLSGGNTATLQGHIEPSEYINFVIDAVLVNVKTSLSVNGSTDTDNVTVPFNNGTTNVIVKWKDSTGTVANFSEKNTYWSLNGGAFTQVPAGKDVKELSQSYPITAPGYNYVTVTTVYKVKAPTTDKAAADYFYADTQTIRIFVKPETSSSNQ